jgi:hypothetical protein
MIYTTVILYAKRSTAQLGKSATDLVEFYADGSPPFCKTEFNKDSRLILQWFAGECIIQFSTILKHLS